MCFCSRKKKQEALALTGDLDENPSLKADLDALSGDLDELRADVERLHDEAAGIQCANPRVLQVGLADHWKALTP